MNKLEDAILLLDTAIALDSTIAAFYNNRGLLYYHLKQNEKAQSDYLKAIDLDSLQPTFFTNLALAQYYSKQMDSFCESIARAEELGMKKEVLHRFRKMRRRYCE